MGRILAKSIKAAGRSILSLFLACCLFIGCMPESAQAAYIMKDQTIKEGEQYNATDVSLYGSPNKMTFTNYGDASFGGSFDLMFRAEFINNGNFTYTGSGKTFNISEGCSFTNNKTAKIDSCTTFAICDGGFINNGTLIVSNITNFNVNIVNNGTIVYGSGISESKINELKSNTVSGGRVISYAEYEAEQPVSYKITYDLNGGSFKETPNEDIFSYSCKEHQYYKIGFDEPFKTLNDNVYKEGYDFAGWTCEAASVTEPSLYMDIMTGWKKDITLKANWIPQEQYVFYYLDGGYFPKEDMGVEIVNDGYANTYTPFSVESEGFTLPTPKKDGYIFEGWALGGTALKVEKTVTIEKGTLGNMAYTACWTALGDTPYTVNVYYMDKEGNYSAKPDITSIEKGETDKTAEISPDTYLNRGMVYDAAKSNNAGTISADGSLVLSLYYSREQYNVRFMSSDGSSVLYSYKGYYMTDVEYKGEAPVIKPDGDYEYTFEGWSRIKGNESGPVSELGMVNGDIDYYAVFSKEPTFCIISINEIKGFKDPGQTEFRIDKGGSFEISLYLEEGYFIGTEGWSTEHWEHIAATYKDGPGGLLLGKDYSSFSEGYGKPVVITIPKVTKDLNMILCASYHESCVYNKDEDVILKEATCTEAGTVRHFCYKCGKTAEEAIEPGHSYGESYSFDESGHWRECQVCGEKTVLSEHELKNGLCAVCGYKEKDDEKDTIKIPVYGGDAALQTEVSISENKAVVQEADEEELSKVIAQSSGPVILDVSGLEARINEVVLPVNTIKAVNMAAQDSDSRVTGLKVVFADAQVELDVVALNSLTEQAGDKELTLYVDKTACDVLNPDQLETVKEFKNPVLLEAYFVSGGKKLHDFGGGNAIVTVPYDLADEKNSVRVQYIDDDSVLTEMKSSYSSDEGLITFIAPHFSYYVISEYADASKEEESTTDTPSKEEDTKEPPTKEEESTTEPPLKEENTEKPTEKEPDVPQTGDNISFKIYFAALILSGGILVALNSKRKRKI